MLQAIQWLYNNTTMHVILDEKHEIISYITSLTVVTVVMVTVPWLYVLPWWLLDTQTYFSPLQILYAIQCTQFPYRLPMKQEVSNPAHERGRSPWGWTHCQPGGGERGN